MTDMSRKILPDLSINLIARAEAMQTMIEGTQAKLRGEIADAYELAEAFDDNPEEWVRMRAHAFWDGNPPPQKNVLRGIIRFCFDAPTVDGPNYNCACRYTTGLVPYWLRRETGEQVKAIIMEMGPESMYEAALASKTEAKLNNAADYHEADRFEVPSPDGPELNDDNVDDIIAPGQGKRGGIVPKESARPQKSNKKTGSLKPAVFKKYSRPWCENRFVVDTASDALLLKCLDVKRGGVIKVTLLDGTEAEIVYDGQDPDGWGRFLMREPKTSRPI